MLEFIIVVLPGILATAVYRKGHGQLSGNWRKVLAYVLFYTIFINGLIFVGLKFIGMDKFNLLEMSNRFKIKWIVLEIILTVLTARILRNFSRFHLSDCRKMMKRLFPEALFLVITYAVFAPSSLFLENIDEFSIQYAKILPVILLAALLLALFLNVAAVCLADEKTLHICTTFVFGIALCAYVQGNFLNPVFPALDGTEIDWASYQEENLISTAFWFLCMTACFVLSSLWKEKTEKGMKYISYFLSAVQMVTLVVLLLTTRLQSYVNYGYSKEGEFAVGSKENIILFLVDTLQSSSMEEYLNSDAYTDNFLDDFTFFDNAVSGGASTRVALPLLMTGVEYDPMQPMDAYTQEIWEETELYKDLHEKGYDVRFYTTARYLSRLPEGVADNYTVTGDSWIYDYPVFGTQLYKLVNFYLMPQLVKPYFWLSENTMLGTISSSDAGYVCDDVQFYQDFKAAKGLKDDYEKSFRLYHLEGVHKPYLMNENIERVEEGEAFITEQQILQGNMKILAEYIEDMKKKGVYDNSTIIILGDHGRHDDNNIEANPAILIKQPYETHAIAHNSAPVHFRNLFSSIAASFLEDYTAYGPSMFDISEDSDVERLHTIHRSIRVRLPLYKEADKAMDYSRFIIYGKAGDEKYEIFHPNEINRISYRMGDIIAFDEDNAYAKQLTYRLYQENGTATASNELSMCFVLDGFEKRDINFHFQYAGLYHEAQKIRVYANGNKVTDMICTAQEIGKDMTFTIPEEMLTGDELIIRMVFPNAVTPNQLDRNNTDKRILSVAFSSMWLE